MRLSHLDLLTQLGNRWKASFDQLSILKSQEFRIRQTRYATGPRYQLRNYLHDKLQPGGKLTPKPNKNRERVYEYEMDGLKRPVKLTVRLADGSVEYVGYYNYDENRIEYTEYEFSDRIPSVFQLLVLEKKRKAGFAYIIVKRSKWDAVYDTLPVGEIFKTLTRDEVLVYCTELFEYKDDVLVSAAGFNEAGGEKPFSFKDVYQYHPNGELESIEMHFGMKLKKLKYYASLKKHTLRQQSHLLAEKIAALIADEIRKKIPDSPVFYLRLVYTEVMDFFPRLMIVTERDKENATKQNKSPFGNPSITNEALIEPDRSSLRNALCEFEMTMEAEDDWSAGHDMLMEVASILTSTKLLGAAPVADQFIVAPLDETMDEETLAWSIEHSGIGKRQFDEWKKAGWLRHYQ